MYKLNGHSLSRGAAIIPETQGFNLQERDSTSTIQLGPEAEQISFGDWILDDGWPEGDHVWRVKTLGETVQTETGTVELEHIIKILDDPKLSEEITVEDIGGSGATTVTAKQAIEHLLDLQSDWVLGTFEYNNVSNPYEFGTGDSLLDGIEAVSETLEDAVWDYDLSVYPFRLNIRKRSEQVTCEMRAGRNLSTMRISLTRSGMYTRIIPIGKNDLRLTEGYLSRNEGTYGRIDKIETDQSKSTEEALRAWARGRLRKHSEPTMTITISGLELSAETGESLDALRLNKICRCPVPGGGDAITERIVKLQWRDRRKEPENVTVELCNSAADVASIIKETRKSGGSAAAGQAKQNYLFEANGEHLYYEIFDECGHLHSMLEMTEQSLRIEFNDLADSLRSEFQLTAESLRIRFENDMESMRSEFLLTAESLRIKFENDLSSTRSEFLMTAESLRIKFENDLSSTRSEFLMTAESLRIKFENDLSSTRSEFLMTAESLRIKFENDLSSTRSEFQMTAESLRISFEDADASLQSAIRAEAGRISLVVEGYGESAELKRSAIILSINNGKSSAHIDADEVYIGNQKSTTVISGKAVLSDVTADYIADKIATISTLYGITASFSGNVSTSSAIIGYQVYADGHNISDPIMDVQITGPTNNEYKLQKKTATNSSWTDAGAFSRAVSSWTMGWSGGKFTAKANPQNQSCNTQIVQGTTTWDGNTATVQIDGIDSDNPNYQYATGRNISIDATARYNAGYTAGNSAGYASGYDACANNVSISPSTQQDLGYGGSVTIYAQYTNRSTGSKVTAASVKVTAPADRYSTGYNAGYDACAANVSISPSTQQDLGYGGSVTIYAQYTNRSTGSKVTAASVKVTAPADRYTTGYNAGYDACANNVSISPSTQQDLGYSSSVTIYAQYTNRNTGSKVTAASVKVTAPADRYSTGYDAGYSAGSSAGYGSGYDACAGTVSLSPSTQQDLGYGGSVTIYAQYTNRSTGSKVTAATVKVTAPADRYSEGYNAGWSAGGATAFLDTVASGWSSGASSADWTSSTITENGTHKFRSRMKYKDQNGITVNTDRYFNYAFVVDVAGSHSPSLDVTTKWTGSIAGRTSKGSVSASQLANTYILMDATCGGTTKKYYLTINP